MSFGALSSRTQLLLVAALGISAFSGGYAKPSMSIKSETSTRNGGRYRTVAQAKRAALKAKRRKAHRMRCR